MYLLDSNYYEMMSSSIRPQMAMRVTIYTSLGDLVYTGPQILKFSESKTAHPIAGELPSIQVSFTIDNIAGLFNPFSPTGYYDELLKGVKVIYEFGYPVEDISTLGYIYPPDEDAVFGFEDTSIIYPYGFINGVAYSFFQGGEVYTNGEISYDNVSVTFGCVGALSLLADKAGQTYPAGATFIGDAIEAIMEKSAYPKDDLGAVKVVIDSELYSDTILKTSYEDTEGDIKTVLQALAHAGCVQMYVDRYGYLHFDDGPESGAYSQYELPLSQQFEGVRPKKMKIASSIEVAINSSYFQPIKETLEGNGEACKISNNYIQTIEHAEALLLRTKGYLQMRNIAEVPYRGEPTLDILDRITVELRQDSTTTVDALATITSLNLEYNGAFKGGMTIRFVTPETAVGNVGITGGGNFIYPLNASVPSTTSYDLEVVVVDITPISYAWDYYDPTTKAWVALAETTDTLTVDYTDALFGDKTVAITFRATVNSTKYATTDMSHIYLQRTETSSYRGTIDAETPAELLTAVPDAQVGDVVLMNNTTDTEATTYGDAYVYDGEAWQVTEASDDLAVVQKDALSLAGLSDETIRACEIYTDLLVANNAFIQKLGVQEILLDEEGSIRSEYYLTDGSENPSASADRGVFIGANGLAKFRQAILKDVTVTGAGLFEGNFDTDLFTVQQSVAGDTITFPATTSWRIYDAYQALTQIAEVTYGSIIMDWSPFFDLATTVTGTFGSNTLTKMIRVDEYYLHWWYDGGSAQGYGFELFATGDYVFTDIQLMVSTPTPTFDSDDLTFYVDPDEWTTFVSEMSALPIGVQHAITGTVTVNGTSRSVTHITQYYPSSYTIGWGAFASQTASFIFLPTIIHPSGSFGITEVDPLVETMTLTPKTSTEDIGTSDDNFRDGWFSGLVTAGTIDTGNGATEIYDMNQDVKSTDSPSFAGLTISGDVGIGTPVKAESAGSSLLPNGLIVKWGAVALSQDDTETVTFPVAFPSVCCSVMFQGTDNAAAYTNGIYLSSKSASNFVVSTRSDAQNCYWIALGY